MIDVVVDVAAAVICFAASCHPVLVGVDTPRGEFQLTHYSIKDPQYGGDLLVFNRTDDGVFAVHRVLDIAGQQRLARIRSPYSRHRVGITGGCVNVTPEVYEQLVNCCATSRIQIK